MTHDKCPVCGESEWVRWSDESGERYGNYKCGFDPEIGQHCDLSSRLAIERAAEIERLKADLAKHTELWHAAQKRSDWFESQRDDLADQAAPLLDENARLKAQLKAMADFFDHYTCLNECGQDEIEDQAQRLIASARETLTEKPATIHHGDTLTFSEPLKVGNKTYPAGHEFTATKPQEK